MLSEETRDFIVHNKFFRGCKLVCIAVSSMNVNCLLAREMEALRRRATEGGWSVLIIYHGSISPDIPGIMVSRDEPFEYLFPFCDVVVTHGGTSRYQAIASLVPMVLVSYEWADQSEVSEDMELLGLGKRLPAGYFEEKKNEQSLLADTIADVLRNSQRQYLPALAYHRKLLLAEAESSVEKALDFIVDGQLPAAALGERSSLCDRFLASRGVPSGLIPSSHGSCA
eukprot:gnl/TRDRNA2_/TRDRNA2_173158_c1_seq7.p1 gnl/TRDRNA2_/TRDRNA2_173158_c1~~gnl/TRDRNA2_/TRDRNA2_173158_c1_seq7.p1  ORF type:complete len:226 (-),score=23.81 gnl/TRDRNA2_/TRDRNA2_173158_c1_seq7:13-690(-)